MNVDIGVCVAVGSLLLAGASFYIGRQSSAKKEGKEAGTLQTDVVYIKESITRIETSLTNNIARLDGRIDEISGQLAGAMGLGNKALENAKSAQKRIDEHLEREHKMVPSERTHRHVTPEEDV
jgi:hypothetical protein